MGKISMRHKSSQLWKLCLLNWVLGHLSTIMCVLDTFMMSKIRLQNFHCSLVWTESDFFLKLKFLLYWFWLPINWNPEIFHMWTDNCTLHFIIFQYSKLYSSDSSTLPYCSCLSITATSMLRLSQATRVTEVT
jgi:hypothetical protein